MLVPHLLKIYFGLGWPSSVLEIVSSQVVVVVVFVYFYCNGYEYGDVIVSYCYD